MNPGIILLGDRKRKRERKSQKITYCMIPFIQNDQNRQIHGKKVESDCQGLHRIGKWRVTANGYRISLGDG